MITVIITFLLIITVVPQTAEVLSGSGKLGGRMGGGVTARQGFGFGCMGVMGLMLFEGRRIWGLGRWGLDFELRRLLAGFGDQVKG